jgi:hypothetical protein
MKKTEAYLSVIPDILDYRINRILNHIHPEKEDERSLSEAIILYLTSSTDDHDPSAEKFSGFSGMECSGR